MGHVTVENLAEIHKVSRENLTMWKKQGVDIWDSRAVISKIQSLRRVPPTWAATWNLLFKSSDEDSHDFWKREKTKEEVEKLRLQNSKLAGEMFDRGDGEKIQQLWAATLATLAAEKKGTWPQVMAGKTEAELEEMLEVEWHDFLVNLSDLESAAWEETFRRYAGLETEGLEESPANAAKKSGRKAAKKTKRK